MDANKCLQCGQEHERKGIYCSKRCTDKAYRDRKKGVEGALPLFKGIKQEIEEVKFEVPKEKGPKLKWCNFCGQPLTTSSMLQFCNEEHQYNYHKTIAIGGTLKIQLDTRTTIETKKYERVQHLIEAMITRNTFLTF
jgi:hypothetical protein